MARRGAWANRNAGHRQAQARAYATAANDKDRLAVAFSWFRSAVQLQARRRVPDGTGQEIHGQTAARLMRDMAAHLKQAAEAIDRGDYDVERVTRSDNHR